MMREATTVPLRSTSCPLALSRKKSCASAGDHQGIDQAQQHGGDDGHEYGNQEVLFHGGSR